MSNCHLKLETGAQAVEASARAPIDEDALQAMETLADILACIFAQSERDGRMGSSSDDQQAA